MKIFITGATGDLGKNLIRQFYARGHSVIGLVRSQAGEQTVQALGAESRRGNLFDADSLARAAEGAEVVIHAATAIPLKPKISPKDWQMNDRIRREGTSALTAAAAKIGARLYLQQSIVLVARPLSGLFFDEDSPPQPNWVSQSALDGEQIARQAGGSFEVGVLRCGWFYGPDSGHMRLLGERLLKGQLPIIGSGQAHFSYLHIEDAASAFVAAAEKGRAGLWHVVDNEGGAVKEFMLYLAQRLGARRPYHIPAWLARLLVGANTVAAFSASTRTSNERFRREVGWTPKYPSYREGLEQVVNAWKREGFLLKPQTGGPVNNPAHAPAAPGAE